MSEKRTVRAWDVPTRFFHWLLVGCVAVSIYTGLNGGFKEMDYHMLSGYTILGLVIFRIIWGFIGSRHARFAAFVRPGAIVSYARTLFSRDAEAHVGHNPLGALSVMALLLVLAIQAGTGLFADDDIMLEGPLVHLVSEDTGNLLTTIHHLNLYVLYGLLGLHITAIAFYEIYKRQRLILAMITGRKKMETGEDANPRPAVEVITGLITGGVAAGVVYALLEYL